MKKRLYDLRNIDYSDIAKPSSSFVEDAINRPTPRDPNKDIDTNNLTRLTSIVSNKLNRTFGDNSDSSVVRIKNPIRVTPKNETDKIYFNDFVESRRPVGNSFDTAGSFKERRNLNGTFGNHDIPINNISTYYGIEDGKLKVAPLDSFKNETTVVPNRQKSYGKIHGLSDVVDSDVKNNIEDEIKRDSLSSESAFNDELELINNYIAPEIEDVYKAFYGDSNSKYANFIDKNKTIKENLDSSLFKYKIALKKAMKTQNDEDIFMARKYAKLIEVLDQIQHIDSGIKTDKEKGVTDKVRDYFFSESPSEASTRIHNEILRTKKSEQDAIRKEFNKRRISMMNANKSNFDTDSLNNVSIDSLFRNTPKVLLGNEKGDSYFIPNIKTANKQKLDSILKSSQGLYPVMVDNGRFEYYFPKDGTYNKYTEGDYYVDPERMFIIGDSNSEYDDAAKLDSLPTNELIKYLLKRSK